MRRYRSAFARRAAVHQQAAQLDPQDGSLQGIQAKIAAHHMVHVLGPAAVRAQQNDVVSYLGVVAQDPPASPNAPRFFEERKTSNS